MINEEKEKQSQEASVGDFLYQILFLRFTMKNIRKGKPEEEDGEDSFSISSLTIR
jgi:hypothetical protein